MIDRLLRQDCVITPRTQTGADDDYGSPTWEDGTPVADRFHYEPIKSEELVNRPGFRATYRAWFRPTSILGVHYQVTAATGQQWEVEGNPRFTPHPFDQRKSHIEVDLVEVQ